MARKATLIGGKRPQLKKRAKRDWSKAKAVAFLGVLATTCNVSEACRQSGVPMTVVYRRRKMDAAFRASWIEAIGTRLPSARAGVARPRLQRHREDGPAQGRQRGAGAGYSNQLGLQLLKMHRDTAVEADAEVPCEDVGEIRERVMRKLRRLRERNAREEAGDE